MIEIRNIAIVVDETGLKPMKRVIMDVDLEKFKDEMALHNFNDFCKSFGFAFFDAAGDYAIKTGQVSEAELAATV